MANIEITKGSKAHLLEMAKDRYYHTNSEATPHIDRIKKILENDVPEDWRFTDHPCATFLIYDKKSGYHILGQTYRSTGQGAKFFRELESASKLTDDLIDSLVSSYIEEVKKFNGDIYHRIKTILRPAHSITQVEETLRQTLENPDITPHQIPLHITRAAGRPNALIDDDDKIWARQGSKILSSTEKEYLLFQRLTSAGIDNKTGSCYKRTANELKFEKNVIGHEHKIVHKTKDTPPEYRHESYWKLPTKIDISFMDLRYKHKKAPLDMTEAEYRKFYKLGIILGQAKKRFCAEFYERTEPAKPIPVKCQFMVERPA